jgi:NADH-quinone oxidoreductase subunit N
VERVADNIGSISSNLALFTPEWTLTVGFLAVLLAGLLRGSKGLLALLTLITAGLSLLTCCQHLTNLNATPLFGEMLRHDTFGTYLKVLFDIGTLLAVLMSWTHAKINTRVSEYFAIMLGTLLGAHLLAMSVNFIMVFVSLEMISLGSYVLAGFAFGRRAAEGSFKYFVFGSVASAIMLYGFSILYGVSGTLNFQHSTLTLLSATSGSLLMHVAMIMALVGFLYKIAAVPMHPWSPDVYEAAPVPVVAYFSVVPKLAGLAVLIRFTQALQISEAIGFLQWENVLAIVAILSITVGNFLALWQKHPKRLMAYSSIAQAGFLLVGVVAAESDGLRLALFYATVYLAANFLVFIYLQYFESRGIDTLESFSGIGRSTPVQSIFLLVGLIALTGLPPTAGFTAKLFVFSALWEFYTASGKSILLWLLIFGLLNTVVSLFYYIRIPYYAFIRPGPHSFKTNIFSIENLFGLVIVVVILALFFNPGVLMGWINKINFAL